LEKEKDWLKLQEAMTENWDEFGIEWKKRGLPYPWRNVDLKKERKRTTDAISVLEKRNISKQVLIGLITFIIGVIISLVSYYFL